MGGSIRPGRYIRYGRTPLEHRNGHYVGPPTNQLYVSIMQGFGITKNSIGLTKATIGGKDFDFSGPLRLL